MVMPFIAFYLTGLVLEMDAFYLLKIFLLVCFYALLHFVSNLLFDDELKNIFPLSVYLATKVSNASTVGNSKHAGHFRKYFPPLH